MRLRMRVWKTLLPDVIAFGVYQNDRSYACELSESTRGSTM